uniref:Uncharacterized protein n=1 Tax=Physcomitrium patens TaxID=3218 RepID=A0A2K1IAA7_PHYPA|nr:hypothetical protein PHYPA_030785 [Physcomitrium patens]
MSVAISIGNDHLWIPELQGILANRSYNNSSIRRCWIFRRARPCDWCPSLLFPPFLRGLCAHHLAHCYYCD